MSKWQTQHLPWDFNHESTHKLTNNFHKYPAMMVPRVVEELLQEYAVPGGLFLDPFCGTGRALLAARQAKMRCVGFDINPLAVLIAKVKLTSIHPRHLQRVLNRIKHQLYLESPHQYTIPQFFNRDYWFSKSISHQLACIIAVLRSTFELNSNCKDFFYVALSETIRDVSWTKKSEYKLYRIDEKSRRKFNPDVYEVFLQKACRNAAGMGEYYKACSGIENEFAVLREDARFFRTHQSVGQALEGNVDIIITSPPYGDSRTTVDYGNFSRLPLQWLRSDLGFAKRWGFDDQETIRSVNRLCLGGELTSTKDKVSSKTLTKFISKISSRDDKRAKQVYGFYQDLYMCMANCVNALAPRGHFCFIVANRMVKGFEIPMNQILKEYAQDLSLTHLKTIERNICGKKLPRRINTNSNDVSQTNTMLKEYVVVFKKR